MSHTLACFWIRVNSATRDSNITDFIAGFYFIYATATTIGYGDVTILHSGTNNLTLTYLFGIVVIALGLVFDAYAQSKIRTMVLEINRLHNHIEMQLDDLEDWLAVRNMTQGVHLTRLYEVIVRAYFSHMITSDVHSIMQTNGFLERLPYSFKQSIVMSATFKYFRRWYGFFKHLNISIGVEIMAACRTKWYSLFTQLQRRRRHFVERGQLSWDLLYQSRQRQSGGPELRLHHRNRAKQ
jgi:flagellin-specific chaperone FliS